MASLAVAWLSTRTMQSFLREEIDQKFPAILRSASDRLDAWYAQRERDIEMLAAGTPIPEKVGPPAPSRLELRANREIERYLADALERELRIPDAVVIPGDAQALDGTSGGEAIDELDST